MPPASSPARCRPRRSARRGCGRWRQAATWCRRRPRAMPPSSTPTDGCGPARRSVASRSFRRRCGPGTGTPPTCVSVIFPWSSPPCSSWPGPGRWSAALDRSVYSDQPGALMESPDRLRIAYLAYRGNPHSGGQGVYTRYLTRELVGLRHKVTVFGGQPYPVLDEGVDFEPVPSLDLYREPDPFRIPHPREFHSLIDLAEFGLMCTAGFPEPLTFSWRARRALAARRADFDGVHDNQCLGRGLVGMLEDGWPLVATLPPLLTVGRQ